MCFLFPAVAFFLRRMVFGRCLRLSAANWALVWVGLEINLLAFVPLLVINKGGQSVEAGAKYFFAQAVGSIVFLLGPAVSVLDIFSRFTAGVILVGLLIKLGRAPTHQWFPRAMMGVGWANAYLIMTWQKLRPLWLIRGLVTIEDFSFIMIVALINGVLGAWGGINQTQLRALFGYSSIVHLGWMLASMPLSDVGVLVYWAVYSTILLPPISLLSRASAYSVKTFDVMVGHSGVVGGLLFSIFLLNLAGMPPFRGFYLKVSILGMLINAGFVWVGLGLMLRRAIRLVFYYDVLIVSLIVGVCNPILCGNERHSPWFWCITRPSLLGPAVGIFLTEFIY